MNSLTSDYIKDKSIFFRPSTSKKELTPCQTQLNAAAEELCLANPDLLNDRKSLMEKSRMMRKIPDSCPLMHAFDYAVVPKLDVLSKTTDL